MRIESKLTWSLWIACWKVGTEAFCGWLFGSVDGGSWIAEVVIAQTDGLWTWRRLGGDLQNRLGLGLPAQRKKRCEARGLRIEMANGNERIAMAGSPARSQFFRGFKWALAFSQ